MSLSHHLLANAGLDPAEGDVLAALWTADGASEASLSARAHVPPDAVRHLVEQLDLLGYVETDPSGVWLTADGFRLRTEAERVLSAMGFPASGQAGG